MKYLLLLLTLLSSVAHAKEYVNSGQTIFIDNTVDKTKVEEALKTSLQEKGIEGNIKVFVKGFEAGFELQDQEDKYEIFISDINLNEKTRRFSARVSFLKANNQSENFTINGAYDETIKIPVLSQKLPFDTLIGEENITWAEVGQEQVKFDTIKDPERLIGQSLKRSMPAGMPIRERDIEKKQVVIRNTPVNILFSNAAIELKTVGIAMDNGAVGDTIRIKNADSNKVIQAVVQDEKNVAVLHQGNALVNMEGNYVR